MTDSIDFDRIQKTFKSTRWVFTIVADEVVSSSCREELARRLPHIDESTWTERFDVGGVYINGQPAAAWDPIPPPCRLEYFELPGAPETWPDLYPKFSAEMVVWRDEDLAVVCKPAGIPTTAPRDQKRFCLQAFLDVHFGQAVHLPSRLDTGVAGLVPVSLSARMNRALQRAYERRQMRKTYLAEVSGEFPHEVLDLHARIGRDPRHIFLRCVVDSGGEDAHSRFRRLCTYVREGRRYSLLQVEPMTGRPHQIRVHLASLGYPIVGDPHYNGEDAIDLRLVSFGLGFYHPYAQREMEFELSLAQRPSWLQTDFAVWRSSVSESV